MSNEFIQDDGQLRVFIVPVDILDVPDLTTSEKLVYIVLRSFVNPTDPTAFPSYETIAKKASLKRRRTIDIVKSLEEKGLIQKRIRFDVSKNRKIKNTSNLYTLVTPKKQQPKVEQPPTQTKEKGGAIIAPPRVQPLHPGGAIIAPDHNHLSIPSLNVIDCMDESEKSDGINDIKEKPITHDQNIVKDEIMDALNKYIPGYCYANNLPLGQDHIASIYLMLLKQFQHLLSAEIVRIAAERYFERACEVLPGGIVANKFDVKNPVGLFHECYKEAIKLYKAQHKPK